jgi:gamma-glutamyltranspeptidase/glutathione hydrolase
MCSTLWPSLITLSYSFQPAIKLARNGFQVNHDLAAALNPVTYPFLLKDPLFRETYAPNGTLVGLGDTVYRKRYADTLETIAKEGADAFYTGRIATNIAEAAWARNGIITTDDLKNYTAILRTPANITYRDQYRIFSTVAPSSGSVVLSALKIFEGYPGSAQVIDPAINETTHRLIQATRFGYGMFCLPTLISSIMIFHPGQRTNYGDPAFTKNVSTLEQEFLQPSSIAAIRKEIDEVTHPAIYYNAQNCTYTHSRLRL